MLNVIACECGKLAEVDLFDDRYFGTCECGNDTLIQESVFDVYGFMLYQDEITEGLTLELGENLESFIVKNMKSVNGIYQSITGEYFALFENQLYKVVTPEAYK